MLKLISSVAILGCIFGGFQIIGGNLMMLLKPTEVLIIFGTGISAMLFSMNTKSIKLMFVQIKSISNKYDTKIKYKQLLMLMRDIVNFKRKRSPKELDRELDNVESSALFTQYDLIIQDKVLLQFISDNMRYYTNAKPDAHQIESLMQDEIDAIYDEQMKPSQSLSSLADACPGLGVLAAVMGIILTMANIDADVAQIGLGIATALVGTFLGMLGCYAIFKPLSQALGNNVEDNLIALSVSKKIISEITANKPILMAVDAGRRMINTDYKPKFAELEKWFDNNDSSFAQEGKS
ncbi:flagellar motor stator protein MotA [Vibrio sp.]|nr:flagellar motor stator protein MotA [Vibrio sp.]